MFTYFKDNDDLHTHVQIHLNIVSDASGMNKMFVLDNQVEVL